jgi:hypothetical protein
VEYDALTLSVTGTAAATDLTALDGKTSVNVNAASISLLTGTIAQVQAAYTANTAGTITGLADRTVKISDSSVTATDLNTLNSATTGSIDASSVTSISGSGSDLVGIYGASGEISGLGNENVSITDTGTLASSTVTSIDAYTTGTVTLSGAGSLTLSSTAGQTVDLSGVTNSLSGTLTINDSTGNENITGTSGNDTINISSGSDTVNAGNGS